MAAVNKPPAEVPLTDRQAGRLAQLTGLEVSEFKQKSIAQLADQLKWVVDPNLFCFRRICGRVVKHDLLTGQDYPVPFATVHAQDVECSFLGLFPLGLEWAWLYPVFCTSEELASVVTDDCGHFCVWIPCFEIEWILRWRLERICFPDFFAKLTIRDLLGDFIRAEPPVIGKPPLPDPPPFLLKPGSAALQRAQELLGQPVAQRLVSAESGAIFGAQATSFRELLGTPAFAQSAPPPITPQLMDRLGQEGLKAVAAHHQLDLAKVSTLNLSRFIGPFVRCEDILVPEIVPILEVPDIIFSVTQDVDGDGDQETIYSENYFDARWTGNPIPDVTLYASQIAVAGVACDGPDVSCGTHTIQYIGLMPLQGPPASPDPYHDATSGYALRVNRPNPSGLITPRSAPQLRPQATTPSTYATPYTETLQLYGCNHYPGGQFYRVLYSYNGGPQVPFTFDWYVHRLGSSPLHVVPDPSGWYPILPETNPWFPDHLLMNWESGAEGLYQVALQVGDGAKNPLFTTAPIGIYVDNNSPLLQFLTLEARDAGGPWQNLGLDCPVFHRTPGLETQFRVACSASESHLRSVSLGGSGCGGVGPVLISAPATAEHWYTAAFDTFYSNTGSPAVFSLAADADPGCYTFSLYADGRAFNPAGADAGPATDWFEDVVYRYNTASLSVAVIDK